MRAKSRFERGKEEVPDKGELRNSVRRDDRAREDVGDGFHSIRAEVRIPFAEGKGGMESKQNSRFWVEGEKVGVINVIERVYEMKGSFEQREFMRLLCSLYIYIYIYIFACM